MTDGGNDANSDGDCADHHDNDENGDIHDNDADADADASAAAAAAAAAAADDDKDEDNDMEEDDMWLKIKHLDEYNICYSL